MLRPKQAAPEAVVLFVGGAFVGAAPQVAYKVYLEALAARNMLVRSCDCAFWLKQSNACVMSAACDVISCSCAYLLW